MSGRVTYLGKDGVPVIASRISPAYALVRYPLHNARQLWHLRGQPLSWWRHGDWRCMVKSA